MIVFAVIQALVAERPWQAVIHPADDSFPGPQAFFAVVILAFIGLHNASAELLIVHACSHADDNEFVPLHTLSIVCAKATLLNKKTLKKSNSSLNTRIHTTP
ncbi:MAG: hypothetical protein V4525_04935 [Pseudomonadota bacterium]